VPTFDDLKEGKCAVCGNHLVVKKDKNLYFKLSAFQERLENYLKEHYA
ncbi:MAG: class I tRNA ligase family protein, partial [Bacteroidales bacterium]|nr:class I tRNA ligase family protein [Bacteroidales bacterium]